MPTCMRARHGPFHTCCSTSTPLVKVLAGFVMHSCEHSVPNKGIDLSAMALGPLYHAWTVPLWVSTGLRTDLWSFCFSCLKQEAEMKISYQGFTYWVRDRFAVKTSVTCQEIYPLSKERTCDHWNVSASPSHHSQNFSAPPSATALAICVGR